MIKLFLDLSIITSDLPTLLGVTTGIFVLAGLICMVLHLFSKTKYPRTRNLGDTHFGPPVLFNSDTGKFMIPHVEIFALSLNTFIYSISNRNTSNNSISKAFITF